ncbi:MAG: arginyl-tRNA synthetase [Rhodoglobus sp.]
MSACRTLLLVSVLLVSAPLLVACVPESDPDATARPTAGAGGTTAPPTAGISATSTAPVDTGEAVGFGCSELITTQDMYDYNPNFGLITDFAPEKGTLAAQAVAASGLACRWMNQTSGETIDISVAQLDTISNQERKAALAAGTTAVSTFGPDGYFKQGDRASTAQLFQGEYWLTATSAAFVVPEDALPIVTAATAVLG